MSKPKPDEPKYTLDEAHRHFGVSLNHAVWDLLQNAQRTAEEDERMIHAAHASCYHWMEAGTALHRQRAEWLIAHVYTVLGRAEPALRHAARCFALTETHAALMEDFDRAYAFECLARAHALAGSLDEARRFYDLARDAGRRIANDEDRAIFMSDFTGGDWHGLA